MIRKVFVTLERSFFFFNLVGFCFFSDFLSDFFIAKCYELRQEIYSKKRQYLYGLKIFKRSYFDGK